MEGWDGAGSLGIRLVCTDIDERWDQFNWVEHVWVCGIEMENYILSMQKATHTSGFIEKPKLLRHPCRRTKFEVEIF